MTVDVGHRLHHVRGRAHQGADTAERGRHQLARLAVVVHDEHPQALEIDGRRRRPAVPGLRQHEGQAHRERRPLSFPPALRGDRPAVELDEVADERQPQAEAAVRTRAGRVALPEALEHVGKEVGADAGPRVLHHHVHVAGRASQLGAHRARPGA